MNEDSKPKAFQPDHFHVTREGSLDLSYEAKRVSLNLLRSVGFVAYKGVQKLDEAILRSHGVQT